MLDETVQEYSFLGFTVATHYLCAMKIIEAGKHVLVEKPFTLQNDHAEELIHIFEKNNVNFMVWHVFLFHSDIKKIKNLIDQNKISNLQYIYSNRLNSVQVRTEELLDFSNHLNNKIPKVANGQHALEVMKILIEASEQLENNENK